LILYTMFNLSAKDYSGLPHYSKMFVEYFADSREFIFLNIIADSKEPRRLEQVKLFGFDCYNIYTPRFLNQFDFDLQELILQIISNNKITKIILQDYLLQEYFENIELDQVERVFFAHLLYRGMLDAFLKEPYADQMLDSMNGVNDIAKKAWLEFKAIMQADTIICNSEFTYSQLQIFYYNCGLKNKKIVVSPLGIEDEYFIDGENLAADSWAYFGRVTAQKGIYYLMRDVTDNLKEYQARPLIVIGEGDMDNFYWRTMMYDQALDYRGLKDPLALREDLKNVKYCVFPSIYEPWGLALTEALAMGKICIVNKRAGGLMEQIEHGVNGFIFNMDHDIINYLKELDKMDLAPIAQAAKKSARRAQEHFKKLEAVI